MDRSRVENAKLLPDGVAISTLQATEHFAVEQGLSAIGLHVFAHNTGAQALWQALGYRVTSSNMLKTLEERGT